AWQVMFGLHGEVANIQRGGIWQSYREIGAPVSVLLNKSNSDVNPTRGYRLQFDATPFVDVGENSNFFTILRLTGRTYLDVGEDPGRSVLALRASFGSEPATSISGIPPD